MKITELERVPRASAKTLPGYDNKNPMHSAWSAAYRKRKHSGPKEGKPFELTQADAWQILNQQGWKCALSGVPFSRGTGRDLNQPSADRIDSSKGYIPGNVQYVTLAVNLAKRNLSDADFIAMCKQVAKYNQ